MRHYENSWPLGPASWGQLLSAGGPKSPSAAPCFSELERLQAVDAPDDADRLAYRLASAQAEQALADARKQGKLQDAVDRMQGDRELLDAALQRQFYLLHGWKLAGELGNYRRFFDIGTLSGIGTELPAVL